MFRYVRYKFLMACTLLLALQGCSDEDDQSKRSSQMVTPAADAVTPTIHHGGQSRSTLTVSINLINKMAMMSRHVNDQVSPKVTPKVSPKVSPKSTIDLLSSDSGYFYLSAEIIQRTGVTDSNTAVRKPVLMHYLDHPDETMEHLEIPRQFVVNGQLQFGVDDYAPGEGLVHVSLHGIDANGDDTIISGFHSGDANEAVVLSQGTTMVAEWAANVDDVSIDQSNLGRLRDAAQGIDALVQPIYDVFQGNRVDGNIAILDLVQVTRTYTRKSLLSSKVGQSSILSGFTGIAYVELNRQKSGLTQQLGVVLQGQAQNVLDQRMQLLQRVEQDIDVSAQQRAKTFIRDPMAISVIIKQTPPIDDLVVKERHDEPVVSSLIKDGNYLYAVMSGSQQLRRYTSAGDGQLTVDSNFAWQLPCAVEEKHVVVKFPEIAIFCAVEKQLSLWEIGLNHQLNEQGKLDLDANNLRFTLIDGTLFLSTEGEFLVASIVNDRFQIVGRLPIDLSSEDIGPPVYYQQKIYLALRAADFIVIDVAILDSPQLRYTSSNKGISSARLLVSPPYLFVTSAEPLAGMTATAISVYNISNDSNIYHMTRFGSDMPMLDSLSLLESVGKTLLYATRMNRLELYDVSDLANVVAVAHQIPSFIAFTNAFHVFGHFSYIQHQERIVTLNVRSVAAPTFAPLPRSGFVFDVDIVNQRAYLASGIAGLIIKDVSVPEDMHTVGQYLDVQELMRAEVKSDAYHGVYAVRVNQGRAFIGAHGRIFVIDVRNEEEPSFITEIDLGARKFASGGGLLPDGNRLYVASNKWVLEFDITDLHAPTIVSDYDVRIDYINSMRKHESIVAVSGQGWSRGKIQPMIVLLEQEADKLQLRKISEIDHIVYDIGFNQNILMASGFAHNRTTSVSENKIVSYVIESDFSITVKSEKIFQSGSASLSQILTIGDLTYVATFSGHIDVYKANPVSGELSEIGAWEPNRRAIGTYGIDVIGNRILLYGKHGAMTLGRGLDSNAL